VALPRMGYLRGTSWRAGETRVVIDSVAGPLVLLSLWLGGLAILARGEAIKKNDKNGLVVLVMFRVLTLLRGDLFFFFFFFEASLLPIA